jgi:glutamine synthetase
MKKIFLEYIWLDGNQPQQIRSKTKVLSSDYDGGFSGPIPEWSFDGSSTKQSKAGKGENTDCILKPVFIKDDPFRGKEHKLVFCEVYSPDNTPHKTNSRFKLYAMLEDLNLNNKKFNKMPWFGWEQEYTLTYKLRPFTNEPGLPLGFNFNQNGLQEPRKQGDYYCGNGFDNVVGRNLVESHLKMCSDIGLDISGINAEVMLGQWEYQLGPVTPLEGSDQLWVSRYILHRLSEIHGMIVNLAPKPMTGDWNGAGCHVNVSTEETRKKGGLDKIIEIIGKLSTRQEEHIKVYGQKNEERLTGDHETASIDEFSWGWSTRDTSVRIPIKTKLDGKGYFEDRRPGANCDPYLVCYTMLDTVYNTVLETVEV